MLSVSTRNVKAITEVLCGHTFSSSTISQINASLDGVLWCHPKQRLDEVYRISCRMHATRRYS